MIILKRTRAPARQLKADAHTRWHDFLILWPRVVRLEGVGGTHLAWLCVLQRRWSAARSRWLWAMPGTFTSGTRELYRFSARKAAR